MAIKIAKPVPIPALGTPRDLDERNAKGLPRYVRQRGPDIPSIGMLDPAIGPGDSIEDNEEKGRSRHGWAEGAPPLYPPSAPRSTGCPPPEP